ncbi:MAG: M1 family metallopeptidase [Acidobacteriota bacterium]|nr:M1 family metallopeptidase [Acidobacteriota bacterium]
MRISVLILAGLASGLFAQDQDRRPTPLPLPPKLTVTEKAEAAKDFHSYADPSQVLTTHIALDLTADFEKRILTGTATLRLRVLDRSADHVDLDTRDLEIERTEGSKDGKAWTPVSHVLAPKAPMLGSKLTVTLPKGSRFLRITYRTSPGASGLQWLTPEQTAGKSLPFMFSQSEAINARSWVPCQDSPRIRLTYSAVIHTPKSLRAVMSAHNDPSTKRTGTYRFAMPNPIPSYLMAIAIGDLDFRALGKRTGVYAEPSVLPKAAKELEDTEQMVAATEKLYGPYAWGRYDILVLPPSFPYGGMENPRLTFATPTILAGDKSLVSLIAHELAHSWSGNLVTNATWSDVWLNEGFTTYVERRIVEAVYGRRQSEMEAMLGRQTLQQLVDTLPKADTALWFSMKGRDPDEDTSEIAYEKGALFLRTIEEAFGRTPFDAFLRGYFHRHAFQTVTTSDFLDDFRTHFLAGFPKTSERVPIQEWVYSPGVPEGAAVPRSDAFDQVESRIKLWVDGKAPATSMETKHWSTQEWQHFLQKLPDSLSADRMKDLDAAFHFTGTGNAEIAFLWLQLAIRHGYSPAEERLRTYLLGIGRRKLILPLYSELIKTPAGKARAVEIYRQARSGYHPLAQTSIDQLLGVKP